MSTTQEAIASALSEDAPVSPPAPEPDGPVPQAEHEADPSPAAKPVDAGDSPVKKKDGFQERIDDLTRNWRETQRELAYSRDEIRRLQAQVQPPAAPAQLPQQPAKLKTLADFGFNEAEHAAYLLGEASKAATEAAKRELAAEQEQRSKQEIAADYVKRAKDFAKEHEDYKQVAETAPISDEVAEIVMGLDNGPEVAYHLGQNPEVALELNRLPQVHAAFELGQIAARLGFEREAAAKAKSLVSAAPTPPPKLAGAEPGSAPTDPEKMSQSQFNKWRAKQIAARKGWSANT